MPPTADEEMRELIRFAGHKFQVRLDGQELVAVLSALRLACRHPGFAGPSRAMVESVGRHLEIMAKGQAPDFELLHGVLTLTWAS